MSELRQRSNAAVNRSADDDDDSDDEGNRADDGVDFQKYAEEMLMKRLLEKEEEEKKARGPLVSPRTGLTDRELMYAAAILITLMLCLLGIFLFFLFTKK